MTTRKVKKCRKMRGSHTHGWGAKKKHRGGGSRGGRGQCGMMKHKKIWMIKNDPDHFGRRGFKLPQKIKRVNKINSITIRDIDIISLRLGLKEFDAAKFGYNKVLSGGKLTHPLEIKSQKFSKGAKEQIEKSGGKAIEG